jgi:uncharacterized membrane protein
LLLFATPPAGVLVAALGFVRERDWVFTGVTVLLLGMLTMAVVVALH